MYLNRSKDENTADLFDADYGRPVFRAIMCRETFDRVTEIIRFDDVALGRLQKSNDKFEPTRALWERWAELLPMPSNQPECVAANVLCNMIDISALNAYLIHCQIDAKWIAQKETQGGRKAFLHDLAMALARNWMESRKTRHHATRVTPFRAEQVWRNLRTSPSREMRSAS